MNGPGVYKWPTGREFHGIYNDNIKEGPGQYKWKNGKSLKCNYVEGRPVGMGLLMKAFDDKEQLITIEEIKKILKNEKKLNIDHSYLEYINSDLENEDELYFDLCSNN